ncbi:protein CONSERVED IN THE GREEN LINEAGE AND DIATOMS 27, chloroplastic-like [Hordeum vulgare subsp. vulgare]|uniref:protein CONSERVED IN THE GREEN LINEAGE AND DIATOMS 27, chloroplastic-like n=1 Tax=Hordeum vulgare subsp. vulgare TaxID=112509 RepID=UPI001D1A53D0|nr:protein CONSERVED IN THE GREEN LINEAGE AND DIATOMS 27, chloroplastic-like [Hordeum vulgare subsp. vulgare]
MAASPSLHAPRLLPLLPNPAPSLVGPRHWPRRRLAKAHAVPPSRNNNSAGTDWCPVPPEQRPVNEYEALATSLPFSWAAGDLVLYFSRLAFTMAAFAFFVGLPVAAFGGRGGAGGDAPHLALGATGSGILAVTLAVVRMYLGWSYVGNRMRWMSLVVEDFCSRMGGDRGKEQPETFPRDVVRCVDAVGGELRSNRPVRCGLE